MEDSLKSIIDKPVEFEIDEYTPNKPKRNSSSPSTSLLLPKKCIFCSFNIKSKHRKPEYLRKCQVKQLRDICEKHAKEKNDFNMISLLSRNDIIAAKAQYDPSCYQDYTRPTNSGKKNDGHQYLEYGKVELEAFHLVITDCHKSIMHPTILNFQDLIAIMEEHLQKNNLMITNSTKKNLRRNIEKSFKKILKFITFDRKLFIYLENMIVEMVILDLLKEKTELSNISKIAGCIRKEIKEMKCPGLHNQVILSQKNLKCLRSWDNF